MMKKELSIYIHIPFCVRKCLYCDFLSAPAEHREIEQYMEALFREITDESKNYTDYSVISVFIGGGTPSVLPGEWIERMLELLRRCYRVEEDCEISLEANPGTVTASGLKCYQRGGVNRLSIGLQSLIDEELRALGRIHNSRDFFRSYALAVKSGFNNINIDLMLGIPKQTLQSCEQTLRQVLGLNPPPVHISAYRLIIEEGTPFFTNPPQLPEEDYECEIHKIIHDILTKQGYEQYEISNYAKPGYRCRHNQVYWRRGNYVGFGLGAASMVENVRFSNTREIGCYVNHSGAVKENQERLSCREQMGEFMFLGLRMREGVSEEDFFAAFGCTIDQIYPGVVEDFCQKGLLKREVGKSQREHRISLTSYGMDVSNVVMAEFLPE